MFFIRLSSMQKMFDYSLWIRQSEEKTCHYCVYKVVLELTKITQEGGQLNYVFKKL